MSDTRQRILDTARRLFNDDGVHGVGVREIARELGMSPGNLAYHFPTKDDLVAALVTELHEKNQAALFTAFPADFTLLTLYRTAIAAMHAMLPYRFVLLSYSHMVAASPALRRLEQKLWTKRRARYDAMVALLDAGGWVDGKKVRARVRWLYEQGEMIASHWLSAAALRFPGQADHAAILHYAKLGCALLEPHTTARGARQMKKILSGAYDAPPSP